MPLLKQRQELRKAYQELVDGKLTLDKFQTKREEILASMEMKRTEALAFARKVLEATDVIKEDYVRDVNQGQMVVWAIRELYNYVEEKVPEKIEAQLKNAKVMREVRLLALLAEARQALGKREDLDNQKDLNVTLQRMLHQLDPHTTYIDPETKLKFDNDIQGNFTGIGIQIRKDAGHGSVARGDADQGQPGLQGEAAGRRPHHHHHSRRGQQRQRHCASRR